MLRHFIAFLCICFLALPVRADLVDDYVNRVMMEKHIPGMTVGVLVKGKLVKIKGYGYANLELKVPATADTVYEIGSITKQFTATAIMMLVEQGKVGLDDSVTKFIEGAPDSWKPITIRNLLTHTSGIKNYTSMIPFMGRMRDTESHDAWVKMVGAEKLDFEPGEKWVYDNSGYYLLGMVVEKASGEEYGKFLKEHIFGPLGMTTTRVNDPEEVLPGRADGYSFRGGRYVNSGRVDMSWPFSAGNLVSSVADFAKWAAAMFEGKLLSKESFAQMYAQVKLKDGTLQPYGFGWGIQSFRGHPIIWHNGGIPGFLSDFDRWPSDGLSVIVFTNCDKCDTHEIAMNLSSLYIPGVKPLSVLKPQADPNPTLTAALRDMITRFGKGDSTVEAVTDAMNAALTPETQAVYKSVADHMKTFLYLDEDPVQPDGSRTLYYRIGRDDGVQNATVSVATDGKISGFRVGPVEAS